MGPLPTIKYSESRVSHSTFRNLALWHKAEINVTLLAISAVECLISLLHVIGTSVHKTKDSPTAVC